MSIASSTSNQRDRSLRRTGWIVQALWLVPLVPIGIVWAHHPRDLYATLFLMAALAWFFASAAIWRRMSSQQPIFRRGMIRWLAAHFSVFVLIVGLGIVNMIARVYEQRLAAWNALPDYGDTYPDIGLNVRLPDAGGMLADNLDLEVKGPWTGTSVRFETNNLGMRRREHVTMEKPEGTFRILFLGDSFVAGYRVETKEAFGNVIERRLNEMLAAGELGIEAQRIEVLCTNTEGFHQTYYYLDHFAADLQPDLIVYNTCLSNDFTQALFGIGAPPDPPYGEFVWDENGKPAPLDKSLFEVADSEFNKWLQLPGNIFPPHAFKPGSEGKRAARPAALQPSPWALGRALQRFASSWQYKHNYRGHSISPSPGENLFESGDMALFLKDSPRSIDVTYRIVDYIMNGFGGWSEEHNVPFIITAIPFRIQVIPQDYRATFDEGLVDANAFDLMKPNRFLAENAARNGFEFIDFTPAFQQHGADAYHLFMPNGDVHWNAAGHRVAAEALLPAVTEQIRTKYK